VENKRCWVPLLAVLLVAGCTATRFSLPPVAGEAGGNRLPGKVVWHDLLTDTPAASRAFYAELFGWQFENIPLPGVNYTLIRHQGEVIGGMVDQTRLPTEADISQWVTVVSVAGIEAATASVRAAGGTVFTPPTDLGERGVIAVVADPQGAVLALLETAGDPVDRPGVPAPGRFLWDELWTADPVAAAEFYQTLAPYEVRRETVSWPEASVDYQLLRSGGELRAGIRGNPFAGLKPMWVNYLRIADGAALEELLSRVEPLGGKVLVPAVAHPAGGMVALIAGPSGAGIALQTWDEKQARELSARVEEANP
jgi:predicted enzyme related to lactoylglutathione lyase